MAYSKYATEFADKDNNIYGVMDAEAREEVQNVKSALSQVTSAVTTITTTTTARTTTAPVSIFKGRSYAITNNSDNLINLSLQKADGTSKTIFSSIAVGQTRTFTADDNYVQMSNYYAGAGSASLAPLDDGIFPFSVEESEKVLDELTNRTSSEVATSTAARNASADFRFLNGRKYVFTNNSQGAVNVTVYKEDGTAVTVKNGLASGSSTTFDCNSDDYVRYNIYFASTGTVALASEDGGIFVLISDVQKTAEAMEGVPEKVDKVANAAGIFWNICNPADFIDGSVWLQASVYSASGFYRTTVEVEPGKTYTLANGNGSFCWYEDDEGTRTKLTNGVFTVPANCHKLRLSTGSNLTLIVLNTNYTGTITAELFPYGEMKNKIDPDTIMAQMKTVVPTYDYTTLSMFPTIAIIGDSFESGGIYIDSQTGPYGVFYDYAWPSVLQRHCGSTVNNYSSPGLSTRTWLTHETRGLPKALSDAGSALYMIFLGINDYGMENYLGTIADITADYTQNPDTFYGNYARIVEQMQAHSPDAKFMLVVPPLITSEFATAIENIADHYDLPTFRSNSDEFFRSDFYANNKGTAHPVAMTYAGMALAYERLGSLCIQSNQSYFFDVH